LAEEHLRAAMALDEENPLPYFNMGVMATVKGSRREAMEWMRKAVERGLTGWGH
jgi:Flp pilus assembly protein TadD